MQGNMHLKDDSLEREIAWTLVQKFGSRVRQLVLVEPQHKSKDRRGDVPQLRLVAEDKLKLHLV